MYGARCTPHFAVWPKSLETLLELSTFSWKLLVAMESPLKVKQPLEHVKKVLKDMQKEGAGAAKGGGASSAAHEEGAYPCYEREWPTLKEYLKYKALQKQAADEPLDFFAKMDEGCCYSQVAGAVEDEVTEYYQHVFAVALERTEEAVKKRKHSEVEQEK